MSSDVLNTDGLNMFLNKIAQVPYFRCGVTSYALHTIPWFSVFIQETEYLHDMELRLFPKMLLQHFRA